MFDKLIQILLISIIVHYVVFKKQETAKNFDLKLTNTTTLNETGNLFHANGTLVEAGWSFRNAKEVNIKDAPGALLGIKPLNFLRYKKYEYYSISTENEIISAYVIDAGLQSLLFFKYYNLHEKQGKVFANSYWTLPGSKKEHVRIPDTPKFDPEFKVEYKNEDWSFTTTDAENGDRTLLVKTALGDLKLNIKSSDFAERDAMIDVLPMQDGNQTWFYNQKWYNFQASAKLRLEGESETRDLGDQIRVVYDVARGMWNFHNDFVWVSGTLKTETKDYGFTLQRGLSTAASRKSQPDYFFRGKEGTQLHPVLFSFDKLNWNNSMNFKTQDEELLKEEAPGTCNIVFAPVGSQHEEADLKVIRNSIRHVYGYFSGWVVDKNGVKHDVEGATGIFEDFYAKF